MSAGRRTGNKPWKHIYGVDRKYTARVDRLAARTEAPVLSGHQEQAPSPRRMTITRRAEPPGLLAEPNT